MKSFSFQAAVAVVAFFTSTHARAEDASVSFTIPEGDQITVGIPDGWDKKVVQPKPEFPPTVRISTAKEAVLLQITFLPNKEGKVKTQEDAERVAEAVSKHFVPGSVEKKATIVKLDSKTGPGAYAVFTDAEVAAAPPKPGRFLKVTAGVLLIGKEAAAFTLMSADTASEDYKKALKIVSEGLSIP